MTDEKKDKLKLAGIFAIAAAVTLYGIFQMMKGNKEQQQEQSQEQAKPEPQPETKTAI